jgi:hypothetical protein
MRWRRVGLVAAFGAAVMVVSAAGEPKAPAISFDVDPTYVGCVSGQRPVKVTAAWRIVHSVTSATITGAVNAKGKDLPAIELPTKRDKRGVVGRRKVRLRCTSSAQTLTLTAVGPGGTTTKIATLNQNRAD